MTVEDVEVVPRSRHLRLVIELPIGGEQGSTSGGSLHEG